MLQQIKPEFGALDRLEAGLEAGQEACYDQEQPIFTEENRKWPAMKV
jgi:hypothetical protein